MQEKALLIDVSTTGNNIESIGGNECPIQFSSFGFDFDAENKSLKDIFFLSPKTITFNIISDENILPEGFLHVGPTWPNNFEKFNLKEGLEKIHKILKFAIDSGIFIIGYNIEYDLRVINQNIARILGEEFILDFPLEKIIDLMEFACKNIKIEHIGSYKQTSVFTLLYSVKTYFDVYQKYSDKIGSFVDNKLSSMILYSFIKTYHFTSFTEMWNSSKTLKTIVTIPFGKYKGKSIKSVLENDQQYLSWILKNKEEINKKYPDLIYTIENISTEMETQSVPKIDNSDVEL